MGSPIFKTDIADRLMGDLPYEGGKTKLSRKAVLLGRFTKILTATLLVSCLLVEFSFLVLGISISLILISVILWVIDWDAVDQMRNAVDLEQENSEIKGL